MDKPENPPKPVVPAADRWASADFLPCTLSVDLPATGFSIGDLLDLSPGSVLNSHHSTARALPVLVNGARIGWAEMEVIGRRLAIRISEVC